MPFRFKLGRRAPVITQRGLRMAAVFGKTMADLGPPPPASFPFYRAVEAKIGQDWRMFLNDELGDCTCADSAHAVMLWTANGSGGIVIPQNVDVLHAYQRQGYIPGRPDTDQGAEETAVCHDMILNGMAGHKIELATPILMGHIDAEHVDRLKWAIQIYGGARLGVNLPKSAEPMFDRGVPWDLTGDQTLDGGHDMRAVGYDPVGVDAITWGGRVKLTWPWVMKFLEEAHAEASADFVRASGTTPAGFHHATLIADLAAVAA